MSKYRAWLAPVGLAGLADCRRYINVIETINFVMFHSLLRTCFSDKTDIIIVTFATIILASLIYNAQLSSLLSKENVMNH